VQGEHGQEHSLWVCDTLQPCADAGVGFMCKKGVRGGPPLSIGVWEFCGCEGMEPDCCHTEIYRPTPTG